MSIATDAQPPALDTVSESHRSQEIEDINDILSKTHSARHAKEIKFRNRENKVQR